MKKPTDITNSPCRCEECYTNFQEEIMVHPIQKIYQGNTRLSWGNTDGSGHITKVGDDFIHIWSEKEKELAKIGGSASLSMHRQNNKPITEQMQGVQEPHKLDEKFKDPPFQYEQLTDTDRQTAEVILRQIFELKHLAREIARDYSPDDQNPASIGQTAKITLDALKAMRDKK